MLFADLENLKVIKEYNYQNFAIDIDIGLNNAAATNMALIEKACYDLVQNHAAIAVHYHINLRPHYNINMWSNEIIEKDDLQVSEEDFVSLVNMTTAIFFKFFVQKDGRKRERRLDVPDKLKCAHISAGLLKRAVNAQTACDVFNLTISCNDLYYTMLDTKETVENE